ncbi:MAG: hypothetical protein FWD86_00945 [Firmicutes bacterium]|nr:hypothetical protein [Bacillota bacterium]
MLIDKTGKIVTDLDFRGTKIEYLDKLTAKELFHIISATLQTVNKKEKFTAKELTPVSWEKTVYEPILTSSSDKAAASKLLSIIVKQALIMSPLPFLVESGADQWEATTYIRI